MPPKPQRNDRKELRARLEARRRDLADEIQRRIAQMREGGSTAPWSRNRMNGSQLIST